MRRATGWALGAAALASLLAVEVTAAVAPNGPRLAVVKATWRPSRLALLTVGPGGGRPVRLAGGQHDGPLWGFMPLSWRSDGSQVAFTGIGSIFLASATGNGTHRLNVGNAERPVFTPDGRAIAFTRSKGRLASVWTIELAGGVQRQLTPWRRGLRYVASSFSPDGMSLLATRSDSRRRGNAEPVALHLDGGGVTRLLRDGVEPVYSPDGSRIALFREVGKRRTNDLYVLDVGRRALRRLTRTPHREEYFASWDPSGERIAFTRFRRANLEWANSIVQVNADGSCETEVLSRRKTVFFGSAWQPGPGREAGPIDC